MQSTAKAVKKQIDLQSDNTNNNLIDVWDYTYNVNFQGRNCTGDYKRSISSQPVSINVYKFLITKFRDKIAKKDWKVVVGRDIEREVSTSPDCTDFVWDMPDIKTGSAGQKTWRLDNTVGGGTFSQIPFSDLQQVPNLAETARLKNEDFGEKNGTVRVMCKDATGMSYTIYSRNAPVGKQVMNTPMAAKVYFPRDVDLLGNNTITADRTPVNPNKPLWFIFWKEGSVISLLNNVNYNNVNVNILGSTDAFTGQVEVGPKVVSPRNFNLTVNEIDKIDSTSSTRKAVFGIFGNHARTVIGTIVHENYHKWVFTTIGWGLQPGLQSDSDYLPDNQEIRPTTHYSGDTDFLRSDASSSDTYDMSGLISSAYAGYGDTELRCRIIQYKVTFLTNEWESYYSVNKDWSAIDGNSNW